MMWGLFQYIDVSGVHLLYINKHKQKQQQGDSKQKHVEKDIDQVLITNIERNFTSKNLDQTCKEFMLQYEIENGYRVSCRFQKVV